MCLHPHFSKLIPFAGFATSQIKAGHRWATWTLSLVLLVLHPVVNEIQADGGKWECNCHFGPIARFMTWDQYPPLNLTPPAL